ncbi:MAG: hypothetical protein NT132_04070 [Microbacterium sp.]|uniref:variant leucine-rich repeat-containing protein n=1 Tax=Microbacterium sp. TaxID=51671 RepID=UPI0026243AEE|nr:hypothetical protein [Microbacterium sp.]MCX6501576.1 hypothetical protein [Microbacterium sp.]
MWSGYDTLLLVTGILTAAIALIPIPTIEAKTRISAVAIGGAVVVLSLILGSLASFTYPALVTVAPVIPIVAAGAIAKSAWERQKHRDAASRGEPGATPQAGYSAAFVARSAPVSPAHVPSAAADDDRTRAWTALFDPVTPPGTLAEIAASYPEFAPQIAAHPQCYPGLREWAQTQAATDGGTP